METVGNKGIVYEFGSFVLDPDGKTLYIDGRPMHLPAKEFETLVLLVENNGRALSKDELMSAIWGDVFVEEVNLAKQISKLRKILNADGANYIETIPKHGYRFLADLNITPSAVAEPVVTAPEIFDRMTTSSGVEIRERPPELPPPANRRWLTWVLAAGVAILILGSGAYLFFSERSPASTRELRSIAVLPFANVGPPDGEDLLRSGLTDALTTKLSTLDRVVVRPTNAVRPFAGQDAVVAGRSLQVDAVLDGSVQRIDDKVRVTVQLIDVGTRNVRWGATFDEPFNDIFRVQDAIAAQVARSLEVNLSGDEQRQLVKRYTANAEAHYAYVRGRYYWNRRTAADLLTALNFFNEAIERDPNYALAYAGLADTYSLMADYRAAPTLESYQKAVSAARRSLELDPTLAEGHTALAYVSMYGLWDFQAAENGFSRAVSLNINYATAHQWYSEYLASQGRTEQALSEIRRAKEIDPLSPVINAGEVWVLYYARRYEEAIELGKKLAELNPGFAEVHEYLKRCYDQKGMYREAIAARQMRRKLVGVEYEETPALRTAASTTEHTAYWKARLEQELLEMRTEEPSSFDMAEIHAQLGEKDKAFEWLNRAASQRTYTMVYLKVAPNLDPLRSDQRFQEVLRQVGL